MSETQSSVTRRFAPNILITGTPGVGKSTLCKELAEVTRLRWLEISSIAIENNCIEDYDEKYKCGVLDEDKLLDGLEQTIQVGGNIVDYHSCEMFPPTWFDGVFVLRTNNTILYDRLHSRGYEGKKLEDNIDCEIFQVMLEEAKANYNESVIYELNNENHLDLKKNTEYICNFIQEWFKNGSL